MNAPRRRKAPPARPLDNKPPLNHVIKVRSPPSVYPDVLAKMDDFRKVCRICAQVSKYVLPLYLYEGEKFDIVNKIQKYLPIKLNEKERMPQGICTKCAGAVLSWHEMVRGACIADAMLRRRLCTRPPQPEPRPSDSAGTEVSRNGVTWKLLNNLDTFELTQSQATALSSNDNINDIDSHNRLDEAEDETELIDVNSRPERSESASEEEVPLSDIVSKKSTELYNRFYEALVNFRNHVTNEHTSLECDSDLSDSSTTEGEKEESGLAADEDVSRYDDLTQSNMRRDRMDEDTRRELSAARGRLGGRAVYTCGQCGKRLSSPHTYLFHKRIHTGERPCVCHVCGKQFRAPGGLQRHLTETHERVRRYSCTLCAKSFVNLQNLKQHFRIHTGERPYECAQCGKRFAHSGSLHVHLKTHSERLPHECAECGAKFRLRSGLTRHRLRHSGERPHACALCGKAFRQRHELATHALLHSDVRPHACTTCGAAFRQRKALRHHARRAHDTPPAAAAPPLAPAPPPAPVDQLAYDHVQPY